MLRHRKALAYALLRVSFGVLLLAYSINKFTVGVGTFADGLRTRFAEAWLPEVLVGIFGTVLPFAEITLGLLLIGGLFNTLALVLSALLMMMLVFGAVAEPNPPTVANNMLFALVVFVLLWLADYNRFSLDRWLGRRSDEDTVPPVPPEEDISVTPRH